MKTVIDILVYVSWIAALLINVIIEEPSNSGTIIMIIMPILSLISVFLSKTYLVNKICISIGLGLMISVISGFSWMNFSLLCSITLYFISLIEELKMRMPFVNKENREKIPE
ncbi:MAG: hypothetical protein R3Y59_02965 [bacterium]